jgi:hypothetical protein
MDKRKTIRIQVKDLPDHHWVEINADDVEKLVDGRTVDLFLSVREVKSYAGLRWETPTQ